MSYAPEDGMPSIFLLQESKRAAILTVFNWTEKPTEHSFDLARNLGLQLHGHNQIFDVLDSTTAATTNQDTIPLQLPPHSVKVLKIIDTSVPAAAPSVAVHGPDSAEAGHTVEFSAESDAAGVPVVTYRWDLGDGTHAEGATISHAYTHAGDFTLRLLANGLDGVPFEKSMSVRIAGKIDSRFAPSRKKRPGQTQ
jgi:PKD repeat protein